MKKISLVVKEATESRIKKCIEQSSSFYVIRYSGLSSPDMCNLRVALRAIGSEIFVAKNTTARRALKGYLNGEAVKFIDGPCGFVFFQQDPVATAKVLADFAKDKEKLVLAGGLLIDKAVTEADIKKLAKMPSKDALRGQVVMALKGPIFGLVMVLKGNLRKMVYCLEQIKQKKSA